MIRATTGVWINYATTAAFQVIFAARYGNSTTASVFVVTFGFAIALGGVATASVQSVVVPRLIAEDGTIVRASLRLAGLFAVAAAAALGTVALFAHPLAGLIAHHTAVPSGSTALALRAAAGFVFLQVVAGELVAIALACGRRFGPAIAPGLPSIAGSALLVGRSHPGLSAIYAALAVGAIAEIVLLARLVGRRAVSDRIFPPAGAVAVATAVQLVLLAFVPPFERIMASAHSAGGAAAFNYALRSLAVAQQLLVGGWVLASLGDWSTLVRSKDVVAFRASLRRTLSGATILLVLAASLAIVLGDHLVAAVYQRGAFSAADTRLVTRLLMFALPGFCAEGIGLILSQALLAHRRNGTAIAIGGVSFLLRGAAAYLCGVRWGAAGVAAGYSAAACGVLVIEAIAVAAGSLAELRDLVAVSRGVAVAAGTVLSAFAAAALGPPALVSAAVVCACFGGLVFVLRPELPRLHRA